MWTEWTEQNRSKKQTEWDQSRPNGPNMTQVDQSGQKGPNRTKQNQSRQNGPNTTKVDRIGPKQTKQRQCGLN